MRNYRNKNKLMKLIEFKGYVYMKLDFELLI